MSYRPIFNNPYPGGWKNYPEESTPINAEALQAHTNAISNIEQYLANQPDVQYKTMPVASESNYGDIVQYSGADSGSYKQGYFYVCKREEVVTPEGIQYNYFWEPISTQSTITSISGLSDVRIKEPKINDVLMFNGAYWQNTTVPGAEGGSY